MISKIDNSNLILSGTKISDVFDEYQLKYH